MAFLLKKLIGALLAPMTLGFLLLLFAFALSLTARFGKVGRLLLAVGLVGGWALGTAPVADRVLGPLESRYPGLHDPRFLGQEIRWILVLGHGHAADPRLPPPARLNDEALFRLTEGIRLHHLLSGSVLLLSGGGTGEISQADALAAAALSMGVDAERIELEPTARDTGEEAARMAERLAAAGALETPFILVTSAAHMPRAMRLFGDMGMAPVAAPAQAWVRIGRGRDLRDFFPTASSYRKVERAVHEYLGLGWARISPSGQGASPRTP